MSASGSTSKTGAAPSKLSFSFGANLNKGKAPASFSLLGADEDDQDSLSPLPTHRAGASSPTPSSGPLSRAARKHQEEARRLDESVFDYDAVYDDMKSAERVGREKRAEEGRERKPKYIENFISSAETRKRDRLRAEAKMIQREREAEGDEYVDKEAFVTGAYKAQQAELARTEEEEAKREGRERGQSKGMGSFYKDMLNKNSLAHDAAVAATLKSKCRGPEKAREGSDSEEGAEETVKTRSDAELAREAVSKGLNVELNDDNLIVDKRELLSAGLNVVSKKVRGRPSTGASGSGSVGDDSRGGGTGDGGRSAQSAREAQRARQSRLMEEQMVELERKRAAEAEEAAKEARKKLARRNDEDGVSSARERYLARKSEREREREREAAKEE